jgi:hypothetical protein
MYNNKMSSAIIDGTNIDTTVFSYSAPKANPTGGKVVNLYNKHFKESLTLSTPLMITWGAQEGLDQAKNPTGKFTMSLQFPSKEYSNADAEAFLTSMRALEAKIRADALTYSKEWFGKEIKSADVMEEKFNVMLRHPKKEKGSAEMDLNKPPTLTVKIPCWKGVWQSEIYDEEGNPLFLKGKSPAHSCPLDFLKPKTHVICLIQCGGLWFVNGKVSVTWNLKQAIVQKPKSSSFVEGTCFLRPKAGDVERLKSLPPPDDDVDPDGAVSSTIVEDSDEEFELPPPQPVVEKVFKIPVVERQVVVEPAVVEPAVVEPAVVKKRIISKKKE